MRFRMLVGCVAMVVGSAGCTRTLVHDSVRADPVPFASRCVGSEWTDDSSLAAVPVPIVAFLSPHVDLNKIEADNYLKRCGEPTTLVNREVDVDSSACVPASLTRVLTLGIYQWCPAHVLWRADVTARTPEGQVRRDEPSL